jgi:hypothetical protein
MTNTLSYLNAILIYTLKVFIVQPLTKNLSFKCLFIGTCGSSHYNYSPWWGGASGNFYIYFSNAATNGWKVSVTFASPVTSFQVSIL